MARTNLLPKPTLAAGDVLLGLASSGVHSNGYSLVRKLVNESGASLTAPAPFATPAASLGEALLTPTRIYVKSLLPLLDAGQVKALAHITGGGLTENLPRVLPAGLSARIDLSRWTLPPAFAWMQQVGTIPEHEMLTTFNCGIGMILVVAAETAESVQAALAEAGEQVYRMGQLEAADSARVVYEGALR